MAAFRSLFAILALLTLKVCAQCVSYGIDYANGGAYQVDASSNQYFTFVTVFQGCSQETINPVLVGPDNNQYACSSISTTPADRQVTSTCGIPFSSMRSGQWKIILAGQQVQVQRIITLTVGVPEVTTVTATPTIVLGITSTPRASTVFQTVQQTQTLILVPSTVTAPCQGQVTVTQIPRGPTTTIVSTILRTVTDGARTSYYTTTLVTQATCHYPTQRAELPVADVALVARAEAAVQATTITVTQTTYTVTSTIVSTAPAQTTTELVVRTITATVAPPASTICQGGGRPGQTVTVNPAVPTVTQTNIVYATTRLTGTVMVGQTAYSTISNAASATACWRGGGWYGLV